MNKAVLAKIKLNKGWQFKAVYPTISVYTTTYNCVNGKYPFVNSIKSFAWADEIIVVDGGSTDGTREKLDELEKELTNLKVYDIPIDLTNPGKDGQQKALARSMCMNEFCIQFDVDEFCGGSADKWKKLAKDVPDEVWMVNLFVAEPVGSLNDFRLNESHNPVKWRLSRNRPEITHGIPDYARLEVGDKVYSKGNSDGCDPVNIVDNKPIKSVLGFDNLNMLYHLRKEDPAKYKTLVEEIMKEQPYVFHVGHVNLKDKLKLYCDSWHNWWCDLFNKDPNDPQNNQYFPGTLPQDVTDEMIDVKVEELIRSTPSVEVDLSFTGYEFMANETQN